MTCFLYWFYHFRVSTLKQAFTAASNARNLAYAPYSNFLVGAALKIRGTEELFVGCNVENISSSATICAERNALFGAIARVGKESLEYMVVVADADPFIIPCGMCLQVLREFCSAEFLLHLANLQGIQKKMSLKELLPYPFMMKENKP